MPHEWQPIETAPRTRDDVLLCCTNGYDPQVWVGWLGEGGYEDPNGVLIHEVSGHPTHWMPLPEPPQ